MNKELRVAIELLKELNLCTEKYKGVKDQRLLLIKDALKTTKRQIAIAQ